MTSHSVISAEHSSTTERPPSADSCRSRHVLHVVRSLEVGGLERLVADMVRVRGTETTSVACFCAAGAFAEPLKQAGARVLTYSGSDSRFGRMSWLAKIIRTLRPDIVHCHNIYAFLYAGLVAWWCRHRGLVVTKHGQTIPDTPLVRWLFPLLLRRAAVVCVSQDIRDSMESRFPASAGNLRYIRNGIDMSAYGAASDRAAIRTSLGVDRDSVVLGSIGRLTVEKGYDVLLTAFANVDARGRKLRLVIAGDGPCRDELTQQISRLGLSDRVKLLGERHDVPELLSGFDAFVLASRSEGQPLSVIEAMASGLPIIATTAGGIPSLVRHGVCGVLVSPNDSAALQATLTDFIDRPDEFRAFGRVAEQTAKSAFGVSQMLADYEQVYEHTLDSAQSRSSAGEPCGFTVTPPTSLKSDTLQG